MKITAINAFATLGGYVYLNTGLIKTADNEAELASVIAHEIGHIGGKHVVKQMRQKAMQSGLATAAGLDRNSSGGNWCAVSAETYLAVVNTNMRRIKEV